MSNANEQHEPESLELNKETLQDLDVVNADQVKGGTAFIRLPGPGASVLRPSLGGFVPPAPGPSMGSTGYSCPLVGP